MRAKPPPTSVTGLPGSVKTTLIRPAPPDAALFVQRQAEGVRPHALLRVKDIARAIGKPMRFRVRAATPRNHAQPDQPAGLDQTAITATQDAPC